MGELCVLKNAFARGVAAAVHVDLQNCYFREETMPAYPAANDLASNLRTHGIANHWIAYTRDWAMRTPQQFAQKFSGSSLDFHRTIDVAPHERIFEKAAQGAFDIVNAPLHLALAQDGVEDIIVTGVIHSVCVAETIAGAMMRDLRVFAAIDATDCHIADHQRWRNHILHALGERSRDHLLTVTTTHDIKQALSCAP